VKCGDLTVRIAVDPLAIRIEAKGGRLIQELQPDATTGALTYAPP
jgi:hypothetical protein